jgi:hypothetical protein
MKLALRAKDAKGYSEASKSYNENEKQGWEQSLKDSQMLREAEVHLRVLQRENAFHHVMQYNWGTIGSGLLLLTSGLGLLVGIKPVHHNRSGYRDSF